MQNDSTAPPRSSDLDERFIQKLVDEHGLYIAIRYFTEHHEALLHLVTDHLRQHPDELRRIVAGYVASYPEIWPAFRAEIEEGILWAEGMRLGIVAAEGDS